MILEVMNKNLLKGMLKTAIFLKIVICFITNSTMFIINDFLKY